MNCKASSQLSTHLYTLSNALLLDYGAANISFKRNKQREEREERRKKEKIKIGRIEGKKEGRG